MTEINKDRELAYLRRRLEDMETCRSLGHLLNRYITRIIHSLKKEIKRYCDLTAKYYILDMNITIDKDYLRFTIFYKCQHVKTLYIKLDEEIHPKNKANERFTPIIIQDGTKYYLDITNFKDYAIKDYAIVYEPMIIQNFLIIADRVKQFLDDTIIEVRYR